MDSQETLIDPALFAQHFYDDLTVLEFSRDSMTNSRISVRGSRYLSYVVESNRDNTTTNVYRVEGRSERIRIASIDRGNLFPDKIILADRDPLRLSKWLKTQALSDFPARMTIGNTTYIWKKNMVGQLSMFAENEPGTPLAWFHRSRCRLVNEQDVCDPAVLAVKNEVEGLEFVLVACLILEHKIRLRVRTSGITMGAEPMWRGSSGSP